MGEGDPPTCSQRAGRGVWSHQKRCTPSNPAAQIENFVADINGKGSVLIPAVHIRIDGEERVYSLLSTRTDDEVFSCLNGVQGQFVDRTAEWHLKKEREGLLEEKIRDREVIEEKSQRLENLATRLAK